MASNRRHLKRHSMPTSWPVQRKTITFTTKPKPGSMKTEYVVALVVLLRDVLGLVHTTREAKYAVNNEFIKVNGKVVTDSKAPIGMFDVVEIEKTKQKFVFVFDEKGKIKIVDAKDDTVLLKVTSKTIVKGGKFQINTMSGFNILVDEKEAKNISTNSTIVYDFKKSKISKVLGLEEKSIVYIIDGKYVGSVGEVTQITKYNGVAPDLVTIKTKDTTHTTALKYCYVVDNAGRVE